MLATEGGNACVAQRYANPRLAEHRPSRRARSARCCRLKKVMFLSQFPLLKIYKVYTQALLNEDMCFVEKARHFLFLVG